MPGRADFPHRGLAAVCVAAALTLGAGIAATPVTTKEGVLPPGTDLNDEPLDQPNELFASELAGGKALLSG